MCIAHRVGDGMEPLLLDIPLQAGVAGLSRLVADDHVHNLYPYPRITVLKSDPNQAAPELGCLTPSKRSAAKKEATEKWNQENPDRPLQRSYYNGIAMGEEASIIFDSSDDPPPEPQTQSKTESQHQLMYQDIQKETEPELNPQIKELGGNKKNQG